LDVEEPMTEKIQARSPADSVSEITELMMPGQVNNLGNVFGGVVLSMVDRAAAVTAMRHARQICVTVSINQVDFKEPIYSGEVVTCSARVNYVVRTSMEIGVAVFAENPITGRRRHTNDCFLTFVAIDENSRPAPVPALKLVTDEDRKRHEEGRRRREHREELERELGNDPQKELT
jgi:acyl-CoA hydrolase